jgi:acylphosphatase
MATRHLSIRGRVQGVGYRDALCRQAERLGVRGWVRNCSDGSVEALAQGSAAALDALIAWAKRGPPLASVAELRVEERDDVPQHDGFARRPDAR